MKFFLLLVFGLMITGCESQYAGVASVVHWKDMPESPQKASCRLCAGAYPDSQLCSRCMGKPYDSKTFKQRVQEICTDDQNPDACGLVKLTHK